MENVDNSYLTSVSPIFTTVSYTHLLSYHVTRKEVVRPNLVEKGSVDKAKFAEYLKETEKSGSFKEGSIVKTQADKIVKDANAKTVLQKAKAIFDWEVANLHRDNSVTGCGLGDVCLLYTSRCV